MQKKEVAQIQRVHGEELSVTRYSNTGSSWHVNIDGKQAEAIAFKTSCPVFLTGLGLGTAHDEHKSVTIKKI